ncbi:TonB-dependent receptor [Hymenobacter sp. CRA2]|nr:TonB-dependent receptor [Hymenobacter sp. CRA2]
MPLLASSAAFGQSLSTVAGTVRAAAGSPIDYATVTLHRAKDSTVVKTEFSDAKGQFTFESAPGGQYVVSASQVGFGRQWSRPFEVAGEKVVLPALTLAASAATQLKEVQVVGQKPVFERLADRTVVNVEGSTLATGNTTLDVLSRAPGVTVDANDNLALRGRQGLLVLIDGKRQPMTGAELADFLRALPADQLKSIELITNPPAKYDAQGSAGIIAINLKKDQRQGTNANGSISYGQGRFGKFSTSAAVNHRRKSLNLFASTTYTRRTNYGVRNTFRYFYEPRDGQAVLQSTSDQRNYQVFRDHFLIYRAGADLDLSKTTRLGAVVTGFAVPKPHPYGTGDNTSTFRDALGNVTDYYTARSSGSGYNPNITANLNFRHTFGEGSTAPELTADADYAYYYAHRLQSQTTFYESARPDSTVDGDQTSYLTIRALKADYVHPLGTQTRLEAGAKISQVNSDNDVLFENFVRGVRTVNLGLTNRFRYDEVIGAAYVNMNHTAGKLNVQLGLRGEKTNAEGRQVVASENFTRDYFQLFPSAALKYTANEQHEWNASLSRRINRPSYRQLNPFRSIIDPATYAKGNPDLRPETSYNVEVNHTLKQKFTTGLSYSVTQVPITDVAYPEPDGKTVSTYVNLKRQQYAALTLTTPLTVGKWWTAYNNAVFYYIHFEGELAGTALSRGRAAFTLSSNSTFTLGKGWGAELNGSYESRQRVGYFEFKPYGQVSAGVQKALWDRKVTVRLAATDIFFTTPLRAVSIYNNYRQDLYLRRDARVVTLSLSWRLGNDQLTSSNRRSGAEEEKRRAQ